MSQIKKKFIKFSTSSDGTNAQVIPANFTPSNYTPTQVSSEGTDKVSAHLKGIDNVLTITPSAGDIKETSFSAANNQSAAANVTSLAFANATVRSAKVFLSVFINATTSLYEFFELQAIQKGSSWEMSQTSVGDSSGFVFTITTAGQIQYTSTNNSGFVAATLKFRAYTLSV